MRTTALCVILFLFAVPMVAASPLPEHLPAVVPDEDWRPFWERVDQDLQKRLEKRLNQNKLWAFLLQNQRMAVGLVDITHPDSARWDFRHFYGELLLGAWRSLCHSLQLQAKVLDFQEERLFSLGLLGLPCFNRLEAGFRKNVG